MNAKRPILGAFELTEPLRRGGMAEVWRGIHRAEGAPVAIKLVIAEHARTRMLREALRNEVRAMARLDHPSVVRVHDYGQVPSAVAEASEGRLLGESPYLVMELAEGGTLGRHHATDWPSLRRVLEHVLGGLAHAHSRGVIHRDIKPSNVLVAGPAPHRFKLSDFGIAHALSRRSTDAEEEPVAAGTAWFMAPEQVLGLYRDEGPWTDLYAVGCLAHLLSTGRLPFGDADREEVYRAHCLSPPPPFVPCFAVPSDFEDWLQVLLAKRPRDRFAFAADALDALSQLEGSRLEGAMLGPVGEAPPPPPPGLTRSEGETVATAPQTPSRVGSEERTRTGAVHELAPIDVRAEERPRLHRGADRMRAAVRPRFDRLDSELPTEERMLSGIGLGVYGLRTIPLAGRRRELGALWAALEDVWTSGAPRVVELRGRAGYGKTRLAEHMLEQAVQTGAAHPFFATFGPTPELGEGLPRMVRRGLRAEGLDRRALVDRLGDHPTERALDALGEDDRTRLIELLAPGASAHPMRPAERFAAVQPLLAALSAERPVVMVFDDAQRGQEAIAFADHLLRLRHARYPVLAVLTVQEDALEERPVEAELLDALLEHPRAERIELGPLDDDTHAQLVGAVLGLEERLARRLAVRTSGNPLFAIQLVGDWVQRGELVVTKRGFRLREGAAPRIPDDVHELWSGRLVRWLDSVDAAHREDIEGVLEIAAVLGRQVELDELHEACAEAGVTVPEGLFDTLASRRLALVGRNRLSFVHGMLSESLERRARERGRLERWHRACARALVRRPPASGPASGRSERIGRHLAAAGEGIEAAPLLARAAHERLVICDYGEVHEIARLRDDALAADGVAASDPRRGVGHLLRAEAAVAVGRLDESERWVREAEAAADDAIVAEITQLRARAALRRGRNEEAAALYRDGLARMEALGNAIGAANCLHGLGDAEKLLGRLEVAIEHYQAALVICEREADTLFASQLRMGLADALRRLDRLDEAVDMLAESIDVARRIGNAFAVATGLNTLGDIARARGRLEEADDRYQQCIAELEALASDEATIARLNLGLVQLARARWSEARATFEAARPELEGSDRRGYLAFVLGGLWVCDAGEGAWVDFDARGRALELLLSEVPVFDDDLARRAAEAARRALDANERERAAIAEALGAAQRETLGR